MAKKPENNRNSIGRFVEGSSGNPNGRPLGSKNKFTTLKNAFIETFEELGGVDNLVEWAGANQAEFYRMVARLMPRSACQIGTNLAQYFFILISHPPPPIRSLMGIPSLIIYMACLGVKY